MERNGWVHGLGLEGVVEQVYGGQSYPDDILLERILIWEAGVGPVKYFRVELAPHLPALHLKPLIKI